MAGINSLEQGRIELGLTRTKALELIGARASRIGLLDTDDSRVDPAFLERMSGLVQEYRLWLATLLRRLESRERFSSQPMTMLELSQLTGVREVNLTALRVKGVLHGTLRGAEYLYPLPEVRRFIQTNSTILNDNQRKQRGHLTPAFLRWRAEEVQRTRQIASGDMSSFAAEAERVPA